MVSVTYHVYPDDGGWAVKREGKPAKRFRTRREAMAKAIEFVKNYGRVTVHGKDGRITARRSIGLPKISYPRPKTPREQEIDRVVTRVILERVKSANPLPRASSPAE